MNNRRLQRSLDLVLATTRQRLLLSISAVLAVVLPSASMADSTSFADTWVVVVVGVLALVVVVEPDEHLAAIVMVIVAAHWIAADLEVTSPWSLGVSASLFTFHTVVALMAVTPHTSVVSRQVLARWLARSPVPIGAGVGIWALVVVFERRDASGSVALSTAAFAVLLVAIVTFRLRTTAGPLNPTETARPERAGSPLDEQ